MSTINQIRRYFLPFSLLIFRFLTLAVEPISNFSLQGFNDDKNYDFNSDFALLGDSQIANGGSLLNLTSSSLGSGSGQIVHKKPFKFVDSKSSKLVSFSTDFTFSISPGDGDGLAFVIVPSDEYTQVFGQGLFGIVNFDRKFVAIEYDTRKDDNVGDLNGNRVGVDLGSFISAVISDVSSIGLLLNGGKPLKSWIDYEASSKRLEIRLGEFGSERPYEPLISYPIDLFKMWGDREVLVGISSSRGNSRQMSSLYSWSFRLRTVPSSLHSQPLDPEIHVDEHQPVREKKSCVLTVLGRVIFTTGCGTLVAFFVLFLWVVIFGRNSNIVSELPMNPVEFKYEKVNELPMNPVEFKYEKVNVTVDNFSDDSTS